MRVEARLLAAVALAAVALAAGGCGGTSRTPIRIGLLSDCVGPFGGFYDTVVAGVELPLIRRGAKPLGPKPSNGISATTIAGRKVTLVLGCLDYSRDSPMTSVVFEARRLVEREGAQIVVGPLEQDSGLAIRAYARRRSDVAFVLGQAANQSTTLQNPAPNLFRFSGDAAQWMAGTGSYAYHRLGWRTAVTIGEDDTFGWDEVAGFVAEFCSLGGNVVQRLWPPFAATDLAPLAARIPSRVDGVFLSGGTQGTTTFLAAFARRHPDLATRLIAGFRVLALADPNTLRRIGRPLRGFVVGSPFPFSSSTPSWRAYLGRIKKAFPQIAAGGVFDVPFYSAMEGVLEALAQVHGDLSGGERRFMAALAHIQVSAPQGRIRLDADRNAVGPNYLIQLQSGPRGTLVPRTLQLVPDVEQTFNGYFTGTTPPPSETQPACKHGNPPPWAR